MATSGHPAIKNDSKQSKYMYFILPCSNDQESFVCQRSRVVVLSTTRLSLKVVMRKGRWWRPAPAPVSHQLQRCCSACHVRSAASPQEISSAVVSILTLHLKFQFVYWLKNQTNFLAKMQLLSLGHDFRPFESFAKLLWTPDRPWNNIFSKRQFWLSDDIIGFGV